MDHPVADALNNLNILALPSLSRPPPLLGFPTGAWAHNSPREKSLWEIISPHLRRSSFPAPPKASGWQASKFCYLLLFYPSEPPNEIKQLFTLALQASSSPGKALLTERMLLHISFYSLAIQVGEIAQQVECLPCSGREQTTEGSLVHTIIPQVLSSSWTTSMELASLTWVLAFAMNGTKDECQSAESGSCWLGAGGVHSLMSWACQAKILCLSNSVFHQP